MNRKILLVSNMYPSESSPYAGIYVKHLYNSLAGNSDFKVDLLTMKRVNTGKFGSIIKYFVLFIRSLQYLFKRYDVIHLHFFYPLFIIPIVYKLFHPKVKLVVTYHGSDINKHIHSSVKKYIIGSSIKRFDKHIAVGKELADTLEKSFDLTEILVTPVGINQDIFYKTTIKSMEDREIDLLYVGSFTDIKGLPELCDCIEQLPGSIKIEAIGVGPYGTVLESLNKSSQHSIKIYYGLDQEHLAEKYRNSKYLIVPSRSEAFGLVVSEAMFCGTPAIGTKVGGIKDQIDDSKNGFLVERQSTEQLVDKIQTCLLLKPEDYMKLVGSCLDSNKQYSLSVILNTHLTLYESCFEGK